MKTYDLLLVELPVEYGISKTRIFYKLVLHKIIKNLRVVPIISLAGGLELTQVKFVINNTTLNIFECGLNIINVIVYD